MTTAQTAYDAAALDRLFTNDYIEISPVGEFDSRAKVLTFYTSAEKEKAASVAYKSGKISGRSASMTTRPLRSSS